MRDNPLCHHVRCWQNASFNSRVSRGNMIPTDLANHVPVSLCLAWFRLRYRTEHYVACTRFYEFLNPTDMWHWMVICLHWISNVDGMLVSLMHGIYSRCSRLSCRGKPRSCWKLPKQISHHNISVANGTSPEKPLFRMSVARNAGNSRYSFKLTSGNEGEFFTVSSTTSHRRPSGIVYTAKRIIGPNEYAVDLTLTLTRGRRVISYVSRLYIFVSEYAL